MCFGPLMLGTAMLGHARAHKDAYIHTHFSSSVSECAAVAFKSYWRIDLSRPEGLIHCRSAIIKHFNAPSEDILFSLGRIFFFSNIVMMNTWTPSSIFHTLKVNSNWQLKGHKTTGVGGLFFHSRGMNGGMVEPITQMKKVDKILTADTFGTLSVQKGA